MAMLLPLWIEKNKSKARQLAAHVGWPPSMVSKVKLGRKAVPPDKAPAIEEFTRGEVSCEEMCPQVKWHILRNGPRSMNAPAHDAAVSIQILAAPSAANDAADVQPGRA